MADKFEKRACIKFYMKRGKSVTKALEMLHQAFDEHYLGQTQVFKWYAMEVPTVTKTKEGTNSPVCNERHEDFFFDIKGIVQLQFVPTRATVNSNFCCNVLQHLKKAVRQKKKT